MGSISQMGSINKNSKLRGLRVLIITGFGNIINKVYVFEI